MIAELAPFLLLIYLGVEMILIATQHSKGPIMSAKKK